MDTSSWEYEKLANAILDVIGSDREHLEYFDENGIDGSPLIYTYTCKNIFIENHSACWEVATEQASDHGFPSLMAYLTECASIDTELELFERVVWLAAEYVASKALYDLPPLEMCLYCGESYSDNGVSGYCSKKCYDEDNQGSCDFCGIPIDYCATDGPFCSDSCKTQYEEI